MKNGKNRLISCMLAAFMLVTGTAAPAAARTADTKQPASEAAQQEKTAEQVAYDALPDRVRVMIVLDKDSPLEAGYQIKGLSEGSGAARYRNRVKAGQDRIQGKIENAIGEDLDVRWNLSLVTNAISAEIDKSDIEKISEIRGVERVVPETTYHALVMDDSSQPVYAPKMEISAEMTGSQEVINSTGYTGSGIRVAILDTGFDSDHQSFNNDAYMYSLKKNAEVQGKDYADYVKSLNLLDEHEIQEKINQLNAANADENYGNATAAQLFKSEKEPYGYNYADQNCSTDHEIGTVDHGSHVAGITLANRYIKDKDHPGEYLDAAEAVHVCGNAPDAQAVVMRVLGSDGAGSESDIMAGLEDAVVLGCDVINMSLGSAVSGFKTNYYDEFQTIVEELAGQDIITVCAAGNAGALPDYSYGMQEKLYADDVNMYTMGQPASLTDSFGVASVDNQGIIGYKMSVNDRNIIYTPAAGKYNKPLTSIVPVNELNQKVFDYVLLDKIGNASDYEGADVKGKIVFIKHGGAITLKKKAEIAAENGAAAFIVYNNKGGKIQEEYFRIDLENADIGIPCASILKKDADYIKSQSEEKRSESGKIFYTGKLTLGSKFEVNHNRGENAVMSSFSSWGVPGDLSLKPEITAPGGNIYSIYGMGPETDRYVAHSGTSMASPQVAGIAALTKQYINENGLAAKTGMKSKHLMHSILMSTADPMKDSSGKYYPVIQQGAGLVDAVDATSVKTYITVDGSADGRVKAEFKDDPEKKGVYNVKFTIHNFGETDQTFSLSSDLFTQEVIDEGSLSYMGKSTRPLEYSADWNGASSVTVPAGNEETVTVNLKLSESEKQKLNSQFKNGAYIEGYLHIDAAPDSEGALQVSHSIPMLGFFGNWTDPSMFDAGSALTFNTENDERIPYASLIDADDYNSFMIRYLNDSKKLYPLGGNPIVRDTEFMPERSSMSSIRTDVIESANFMPIRNAEGARSQVEKPDGTVEVLNENIEKMTATYFDAYSGRWDSGYNVKLNYRPEGMKEGEKFTISVVLAPEYYVSSKGEIAWDKLGKGASMSSTVTIDNTAPVINKVTENKENDTITVNASDNRYIAGVRIYDANGTKLIAQTGSLKEAETGQSYDYVIDTKNLDESKGYTVKVYDYANNYSKKSVAGEPGSETDPDNPGTDPDNPGTDPDNPGTDPDQPGTDPDKPGTDPDPDKPGPDKPDVSGKTEIKAGVDCTITEGGTYSMPSGDYGSSCITINTKEPVTLTCAGSKAENVRIRGGIAGINLTLKNVEISNGGEGKGSMIDFTGKKNRLIFEGENILDYEYKFSAGFDSAMIHAGKGTELTVSGGTLYAYKAAGGAMIGGDHKEANGDINIENAEIFAKNSKQGELIGCGSEASGAPGHITIEDSVLNLAATSKSAALNGADTEITGSSLNIYTDFKGDAIGGTGAGDGGNLICSGSSVRTYITENAAGSGAWDGVSAEGVNGNAAITADVKDRNGKLLHLMIFDTDKLSRSSGSFTVKESGRTVYSGGLHEYQFNDSEVTKNNWKSLNDSNLYLYMTGADHKISVNGEVFDAKWNGKTFDIAKSEDQPEIPGGGGAGGGGMIPMDPVETKPEIEAGKDGTAKIEISDKEMKETIAKAKEEKKDSILINPEIKGEASKTIFEISVSSVRNVSEAGGLRLVLKAGAANAVLSTGTLEELAKKGEGVKISISSDENDGESTIGAQDMVPFLINSDGSETIIKKSVADGSNLNILLEGSADVVIRDNAKEFSDVDNHWAKDFIAFAASREIFNGTGGGMFTPDGQMTRGMLVKVLHNLENSPECAVKDDFDDVAGSAWYAESVAWAVENGIISGYGEGKFGPEDSITREQLAVILYRYAGEPESDAKALKFSDAGKVSSFAEDAVKWAVEMGIVNGMGDGSFKPQGRATRAEVATMIERFCKTLF